MSFCPEKKAIFASLPKTERATSLVLGGDPKGKNFLYAHDNNIFIRDIENPVICDIYSEHSAQTTVAKYAPSGFYIASGDVTGKIRIWDTTQKEHILKYEYQPLSGKINDIAWSPDSKRIAVCGKGRENYGAVFLWDSGSSVGQVDGHSKDINSIDYKPTRPFRLITGSEDMSSVFYEGPPFKYKYQHRAHSNFVNTVRFSPDGNFYATGGSDGKLFLYSGKEGELVCEIVDGAKAHSGGIYGVCWSPDSTRILTASADKSAKLWDADTKQLITKFELGTAIEDQQLSCLWQGEYMLTVSLSGYINYLDKNNPSTPARIIKGHNKNITAMTLSQSSKTVYSAGLDNKSLCWDVETGDCVETKGKGHSNMVNGMRMAGSTITSIGVDDQIRFQDAEKKEFMDETIGLDAQPLSVDTVGDKMAIGTDGELSLYSGKTKVFSEKVGYKVNSLCFNPSASQLAVGGGDSKIHIFDVLDSDLKEVNQLTNSEPVDAIKFSPNGEHLACSSGKQVFLWQVEGYMPVSTYWSGHLGRILTLSWSPDSKRFATGGVDSTLRVWDLANYKSGNCITGAHPKATIVSVSWLDDSTVVSAAHDKCVKVWKV